MPPQSASDGFESTPDYEELIKAQFPYTTMSPEEYVARHAHLIGTFGIWRWKFRDPALAAWLRAVHENLHDREKREACCDKFLSAEERRRFREIEQEEF
jgi:hypothetical protein